MRTIFFMAFCLWTASTIAAEVDIPNTFIPNQPAIAAEVNANFAALETAVNDNDARLAVTESLNTVQNNRLDSLETLVTQLQASLDATNTNVSALQLVVNDNDSRLDNAEPIITTNNNRLDSLETLVTQLQASLSAANATIASQQTTISQLQADLGAVENNSVLALDGKLTLSAYDGHPTALFDGINVQITDGSGDTSGPVNGLGNLIVGYNEDDSFSLDFCSNPTYTSQQDCQNNGGIWDNNVHRGSHNLVVGIGHSYDDYGAVVAGISGISNAPHANVLGGDRNTASGLYSVVSGGVRNTASGINSSVSGGQQNTTSASGASVSGGLSITNNFSNTSNNEAISQLTITASNHSNSINQLISDTAANTLGLSQLTATVVTEANTNISQQNSIDQLLNYYNTLDNSVFQIGSDLIQAESEINLIQANSVLSLDGYLSLGSYDGYDTAVFEGINLQVTNGSGLPEDFNNGLGNVIIGYNENDSTAPYFCLNPDYENQADCQNNGSNWVRNIHTGSHNLVVGESNSYSSEGAIIAGTNNVSNYYLASVIGGANNIASGYLSNITGGYSNKTTETLTVVVGGRYNLASNSYAVVVGGSNNEAGGLYSVVSGGYQRAVSGSYDWRAGSLIEGQ